MKKILIGVFILAVCGGLIWYFTANKEEDILSKIEVGMTQDKVHEILGEPDEELSEMYGDIYEAIGVILYDYNYVVTNVVSLEEFENNEQKKEIDNQVKAIMSNMDLWTKDSSSDTYGYVITDLDQNGRIEIISSSLQGTGLYTYSKIYEVDETQEKLNLCNENDYENGKGIFSDFMMNEETVVFYDREHNEYHYIFYDYTRISATESQEAVLDVCLKDGVISEKVLAIKTSVYENENNESIAYKDADGKDISESEYSKIADTTFAGYTKMDARLGWVLSTKADLENITNSELETLLRESYDEFIFEE